MNKTRAFGKRSFLVLSLLATALSGGTVARAQEHTDAAEAQAKAPAAVQTVQSNEEHDVLPVERQHRQNFDAATNQVQVFGTSPDANKSFSERYSHPPVISSFGQHIDNIFAYTSWTTFVFFVLMASSLLYFAFAYRKRPGHKAYYTHGLHLGEKTVAKLLDIAVFLSLDAVLIYFSWADTRHILWAYPNTPDTVKIQVMPQQWAWNFKYAGNDGIFGTADDIDTINDLRIPVGHPVMIQMKSRDVIHGFFLPNVRMQVDAIPGVITKFWFDANTTGDFELACYHHCGTAHYKMKAFMRVMTDADFKAWSEESSKWAAAKYDPEDNATKWGWAWGPDPQTAQLQNVSVPVAGGR